MAAAVLNEYVCKNLAENSASRDLVDDDRESSVMHANADMRITCNIPRSVFLCEDCPWKYRADFGPNGKVVGIRSVLESDVPMAPIVNKTSVSEALKNSSACIDNNFPGMSIFQNMFPVHVYDDMINDKRAYAVFINMESGEAVPSMNGPNGRILYVRDPIRPNSDSVICPLDPDLEIEVPVVTTMNPVSVSPLSGIDVGRVVDARQVGIGIMIFSLGSSSNTSILVLHHDMQKDGLPLLPVDNFGNRFILTPDMELLFPMNRAFHGKRDAKAGDVVMDTSERLLLPVSMSARFQTGHVGKRVLQIMAHYFGDESTEKVSLSAFMDNPESLADQVTTNVAESLHVMLINSETVRQAVVDQLYTKVGAHVFNADGQEHTMYQALMKSNNKITLCVNSNHQFRLGTMNGKHHRNVIIRSLPIVIDLV